ncbi:MAG: type II toxin-antitoxin system VapC family toxin [Phenylobacterium sp.]|nr:type II toxin-antitoxin system VapC family toxin [Phenylobacterium sp.]
MFVDASALVAILVGEPDAPALLGKLEAASSRITSSIAVYEAVLAVSRIKDRPLGQVRMAVKSLLARGDIRIVDVGPLEGDLALDAFDRYGKGRHPARLNMGDCFAYACARTHGVPLLFKGDDFGQTDVMIA